MRIVSWNIQAGKVAEEGSDLTVASSYKKTDLGYIVGILKKLSPDIVLLQEIHENDKENQLVQIAQALNFPYTLTHRLSDESFMDSDFSFSQGIISKYKMTKSQKITLDYTRWKHGGLDGKRYISRDSILSMTKIKHRGTELNVGTTHFVPFHAFKVDPKSDQAIEHHLAFDNVAKNFKGATVLAGDFNIDSKNLKETAPEMFANNNLLSETMNEPTLPRGKTFDHVLHQDVGTVSIDVDNSTLTDHFPVVIDV